MFSRGSKMLKSLSHQQFVTGKPPAGVRRGPSRQRHPMSCAWVLAGCWLCVAAFGCGSRPAFEFDQLDLAGAEEHFDEFPLGEYTIPIPAADWRGEIQATTRTSILMDFELFALVSPGNKSSVADAWDRHEGKIRDRVIRICRNSSLEVLHEPELGTLKAKLMDALGAHLGDDVNQLLITELVTHEI
jgi:hypothetical protein